MFKRSFIPLVIMLLVACQSTPVTFDAATNLRKHEDRNCGSDDLKTDTAGWHRSGSVGGIGLFNAKNQGIAAKDVLSADTVAWDIRAALQLRNIEHDVVMFIVDDFGSSQTNSGESVYRLDPSVYALNYDAFDNDPSTPPLKKLSEHLDTMLAQGQLSHGAMVLTYTIDLLHALKAKLLLEQADKLVFELSQTTFTLQAVEVSGFDTSQIKNALQTSMNSYQAQGQHKFVVNFSFTLEPCDTLTKKPKPTSRLTPTTLGPGDALYDFIQQEASKHSPTIFVAAAGNHSGEAPHAPANWPAVISSSASIGSTKGQRLNTPEKLAFFSNQGEIMMRGAWLNLRDPFALNGAAQPASEVVLAGNSLSSPAVALASMLDLSTKNARCVSSTQASKLAHGNYTNRPLKEAVQHFCSL